MKNKMNNLYVIIGGIICSFLRYSSKRLINSFVHAKFYYESLFQYYWCAIISDKLFSNYFNTMIYGSYTIISKGVFTSEQYFSINMEDDIQIYE
jgi:hypothetical protein